MIPAFDEIQIFAFFFVLIRVSSFVAFFPFFGDAGVPIQVKVLLSLVISAVFMPLAIHFDRTFVKTAMNSDGLMLFAIASEITLGFLMGYLAKMAFQVVQTAGHFMATQMGLSIANIFDPISGTQTNHVEKLFYVLTMMLFLALNAHYVLLGVLKESFVEVPPASLNLGPQISEVLNQSVITVLAASIKLAAPVVVVTMIMNAAMGLVSRSVPQMNVMLVAFAVNILIGLFVMLASLPMFMEGFESLVDDFGATMFRVLKII